jgi:hypothetical protein
MHVQKLSNFLCLGILFSLLCSFAVVPPVEKQKDQKTKKEIRLEKKQQRLETKLFKTTNLKKQQRIKSKLDKLDKKEKTKNIFAILGFSLAILSLIFIFVWASPIVFFIGLGFSIVALVFSILGIKAKLKGLAIAGIVISSIALLLGLLFSALLATVLFVLI